MPTQVDVMEVLEKLPVTYGNAHGDPVAMALEVKREFESRTARIAELERLLRATEDLLRTAVVERDAALVERDGLDLALGDERRQTIHVRCALADYMSRHRCHHVFRCWTAEAAISILVPEARPAVGEAG